MPAMHTRDRIGVHGERHVLMNSRILPPDSQRVRIRGVVGLNPTLPLQSPPRPFMVQLHRGHQLSLSFVAQFPPSHVMTTGDDPWFDSFRYPCGNNEVTDFSLDAKELTRTNTKLCRVCRVY